MLAGTLYVLDKIISRPARIEFARREDDLQTVRDAVMRCEYENGSLPDSLDSLVPRYLRESQVTSGGRPLYVYSREKRSVAMAEGATIRGIVSREWPPIEFVMPPLPARAEPKPVDQPEPVLIPEPEPASELAPPPVKKPATVTLMVPGGSKGAEPPEGALVIEAEHYSELNWGWEVHPDKDAGGGGYIICKEGTTTGSAQCHWGTYNFYDIQEGEEQSVLKYHFSLPEAGQYYILGRMFATCTHCSNSINVGVDTGGLKPGKKVKDYYGKFMGSSVPFRWRWTHRGGGAVYLKKGDHFIHIFPHEDGLRIDQLMLLPKTSRGRRGADAYRANFAVNRGTAFAKEHEAPVDLTFDLKSMVMTEGMPCACSLAVRRIRESQGTGTVRVFLREAGPGGDDLRIGEFVLDLPTLPELGFIPLDFSCVDYGKLPRREYLLEAELAIDGKTVAGCDVPLMHPFEWKVSDMFEYLGNSQPGPLDGDGGEGAWQPFKDSSWTPLGVMDFGVQTVGNSLHAPEMRTIYAETEIEVPETAAYMLKAQSDDQMILWIDGKKIEQIDTTRSVIRNSRRWKTQLEKGMYTVRIRVNQGRQVPKLQGGYWQASLRFRTADDSVSNVTGK